MAISIRDFEANIIGKISRRFKIVEKKKHHIYYEVWDNDKKICGTHRSHKSSGKEIYNNTLSEIAHQLKLNNLKQLYLLEECSFSEDDYFNLIKEKQKDVIGD